MDYHGWYSEKQFEVCKKMNEEAKINKNKNNNYFKPPKPYIYYKNQNDEIIQITEITSSLKNTSKFDDVKYLGIMKKFHITCEEPIQ